MKLNSKKTLFENNALRLGGTSKRNRTDLRKLPHQVIDRGRRMSQARLYKIDDVLSLRKAHFAKWKDELARLKQNDKPS